MMEQIIRKLDDNNRRQNKIENKITELGEMKVSINLLNQRVSDLNTHITKLIDVSNRLSFIVGRISVIEPRIPEIRPIAPNDDSFIPKIPNSDLIEDKKRQMIILYEQGKSFAEIGRQFGVSRQYVHRLLLEKVMALQK
jgi:hypothetical protein